MKLRTASVLPWDSNELAITGYDFLFATLGFESRARALSERYQPAAARQIATGFKSRHQLSYESNLKFFRRRGFEVNECDDSQFDALLADSLADEVGRERPGRILVDISSMSRRRIASTISWFMFSSAEKSWLVDFVYIPAKFSKPPKGSFPIAQCAPVIPEFAGWTDKPEQETTAVFGLGFEEQLSVGAFEKIEPTRAWAFVPRGVDARYDRACEDANEYLRDSIPRSSFYRYGVEDPYDAYTALEGLVYSEIERSRLVVVPLGPKMFALSALAAAVVHWPRLAVWRVSSDQRAPASNRVASDSVVGLRVVFPAEAAQSREY